MVEDAVAWDLVVPPGLISIVSMNLLLVKGG
jgi:hypothetical protein